MNSDRKIEIALKKAHSHLGKVLKMVERGEYCVDIMQQNLAVIGLLRAANNRILERHLESCFVRAVEGSNEKRKHQMIQELVKLNKHIS